MNLSASLSFLLCTSASASFTLPKISYDDLVNQRDADEFLRSLETVGIVCITNIPMLQKDAVLQSFPKCAKSVGVESSFPDGTLRLTVATHSRESHLWETPGSENESCDSFNSLNQEFRSVVGQAVDAFGFFLQSALALDSNVLYHADDKETVFSLKDIFQKGDHLEHFHAYYTSNAGEEHDGIQTTVFNDTNTIAWHIDQGLLLAFSPGQSNGHPTEGFYIELLDGSTVMVHFDREDDLVFLLGDGVNQIINPLLIKQDKTPLRVVPHALSMPQLDQERIWYGRMVLPPPDALHPFHGSSFGEIRESMIQNDEDYLEIGCSGVGVARILGVTTAAATTCDAATSSYCWHLCMKYADYNASPSICASRQMQFGCVNEKGEPWPDIHDPSYKLRCYNKATAKPTKKPTKKPTRKPTKRPTRKPTK